MQSKCIHAEEDPDRKKETEGNLKVVLWCGVSNFDFFFFNHGHPAWYQCIVLMPASGKKV